MWQYVVMFILSSGFTALADNSYKRNKNKLIYFLLSAVAIGLGAFLAGARAETIGTDIQTYGKYVFAGAAETSNIFVFYAGNTQFEPLFLLLNYVVARFTSNPHWFYFFLQLLTLLFVYLGVTGLRDRIHPAIGMCTYYTLFYAFSLNGMRQAAAMAIIFWGFRFIERKQWKKYVIAVLLAAGFHYTAVAFVVFYPMYQIIAHSDNKRRTDAWLSLAMVGLAVGFRIIVQILALFVPKYSRYLAGNGFSMSLNPLILRLPFLLVMLILYRVYRKKEKSIDFWLVLLVGDMIFAQLRSIIPALYRISLFFGMIKIYAYPGLAIGFKKESRWRYYVVLVAGLFLIWFYQIVLQGNEEVYPYVSDVFMWLN